MRIDTKILNVLDRSACAGRSLFLPEQLERREYMDVAKVITSAGGKWIRKIGAHVFPGEAADAIEQIILTGEVSTRQETQQFFTPLAIGAELVSQAMIRPGMSVLEPSAGDGALVRIVQARGGIVWAYEKDQKLCNAMFAASLMPAGCLQCRDFLLVPAAPTFDAVVMNPPFAKQADIRHVKHALQFLRPGGRLAAIMSAGTMFRENALAVDFREEIAAWRGTLKALPNGSFKDSGTMVNTCMLTIGR